MALDTTQYATTVPGRGDVPITTYAPNTTLGYSNDTIDAIPGLRDALAHGGRGGNGIGLAGLNDAMSNPTAYAENNLMLALQSKNQDQINANVQFLNQQGLDINQIQDYGQNLNTQYQQNAASSGGFLSSILSNPTAIAEIAAAATIPGMAEALAPSIASALSVSSATATAIAGATLQAGVQVAAGVPLNTAIQNAAIGTVVSTGANDAAKALIYEGGNQNAVNAVTSGVAGAVKTAAQGGNASQILENATAGAAGSLSASTAQALGAGQPVATAIGGAVGGATEAGGNSLSALSGLASGYSSGTAAEDAAAQKSAARADAKAANAQSDFRTSEILAQNQGTSPTDTGTTALPPASATTNVPSDLNPVTVTAPRLPTDLGVIDLSATSPNQNLPNTQLQPVTIKAQKDLGVTQLPDVLITGSRQSDLGNVDVTGSRQSDSGIVSTTTQTPGGSVEEPYNPGLFIYGNAPKALNTNLGSLPISNSAATTGTTSGTTGGEPGGTELDPSTGKAPEQVWGDKYSSLKEGLNI